MNAEILLERLRDESPGGPVARLADLAADELLATPVGELIDATACAEGLAALVESHLEDPEAHRALERRIEEFLAELEEREESVGDLFAEEVRGFLTDLAERPFAPDRHLILAWLNREPVRRLLRKLMQEALVAFGRKMSGPVAESPITRGLGGLGRLARDAALGKAGAFGAIATDIVGAVSSEVERQLERRAGEFADAALGGLLERISHLLSDPDLLDEQIALRKALLEGVLEVSTEDLARETRRSDPAALGALVREWMRRWLDREGAEEELADAIAAFIAPDAERPLVEVLAELGVAEAARDVVADFFEARLRPFFAGEPFAAWLRELVR